MTSGICRRCEFYWGHKGFSFRVVLQGKQYAFIWGYPRTVWWLKDRDKGDRLSVLVEPAEDRLAELKRLVTTTLGVLREDPSAQSEREGGAILASYYVQDDLDPAAMERLQERVNALFQAANQAGEHTNE